MTTDHVKVVTDTDPFFEVDVLTRAIKNTSLKPMVMQYDHNSERFTFSLPRYIENHDMLEGKAEVHYLNKADSTQGIYEITDLQVDPADETKVIGTWLLSQNVTMGAGELNFLLRFSCVDTEGNIEYAWNTDIYKGIHVKSGMWNSPTIAEQYPDVLQQWKNEIDENLEACVDIPVCKACIPISEEGRKLALKPVEGLEAGGLFTKLIVSASSDLYWQSRVIESIEEYEPGTKIEPTDSLSRPRATWETWAKSPADLGFGGVPNKDELQIGQKIYLEGTISDENNTTCWLLGVISEITDYVKLEAGTRIFLDKSPFNTYVTLKSAGFSSVIPEPLNESSLLSDGLLIYEDGMTVGNITLTREQLGEDLSIIEGIDLGVLNEVGFGAFVNGHHNKSTGIMSHTTGEYNTNTGYRASCENSDNNVSGKNSSAKGYGNIVSGDVSSAEGNSNEVTSDNAHVEGMRNKVTGKYGHGEGYGNIVASDYQHVQGRWNEADSEGKYVDIVGYGSGPEPENRKNIYTLDTEGNASFAGNITCMHDGEAVDLGDALTGIEKALLEIEAMADSLIGGDS